jgi:hypothetical protein
MCECVRKSKIEAAEARRSIPKNTAVFLVILHPSYRGQ